MRAFQFLGGSSGRELYQKNFLFFQRSLTHAFIRFKTKNTLRHQYEGVIIKTGFIQPYYYGCALAEINVDPISVLTFLWNFLSPDRAAFSSKTDLAREEIEVVNNHHKVLYVAKRLPPPLHPRDFLVRWIYRKLSDGRILISNKSCTHMKKPVDSTMVRGDLNSAIMLIPSFGGSKTRVQYVLHADPKGLIPAVLGNRRIIDALSLVWETRTFFSEKHLMDGLAPAKSKKNSSESSGDVISFEDWEAASHEKLSFSQWLKIYMHRTGKKPPKEGKRRTLRAFESIGKYFNIGKDTEFEDQFKVYMFQDFTETSHKHLMRRNLVCIIPTICIATNFENRYRGKYDDIGILPLLAPFSYLYITLTLLPWIGLILYRARSNLFYFRYHMNNAQVKKLDIMMTCTFSMNMVANFMLMAIHMFVEAQNERACSLAKSPFIQSDAQTDEIQWCVSLGEQALDFFSDPILTILFHHIRILASLQCLPAIDPGTLLFLIRIELSLYYMFYFALGLYQGVVGKHIVAILFLIASQRTILESWIMRLHFIKVQFYDDWTAYVEHYRYESRILRHRSTMTSGQRQLLNEVLKEVEQLSHERYGHKNSGTVDICDVDPNDIEFERQIGDGKFGIVFLGKYHSRAVAVKQLIPESLSRGSVMNFVGEIYILSLLRHPNIIRCYGAVLSSMQLCLVTEYAKNGSLKSFMKTSTFTWDKEKREWLIQICAAMKYLHSRDPPLIHRDLKPDNCLVMEDMAVKVSDFGLARTIRRLRAGMEEREMSASQKKTPETEDVDMSTLVGTPMFMAPEIIRGDNEYGDKIDVYSFGVLLADVAMDGNLKDLFCVKNKRSVSTTSTTSVQPTGNGSETPVKENWDSSNLGDTAFSTSRFLQLVSQGWRFSLPKRMLAEIPIIALMVQKCTLQDPKMRPTFSELREVLVAWNGELDGRKEPELMHNMEPYSKFEDDFIKQCFYRTMHIYDLKKPIDRALNDLEWYKIQSPDPAIEMALKINFVPGESGGKRKIIVGKGVRKIKASSYKVLNWVWDWMNPSRVRLNKGEGELERSIVEEVNEHHRIVSTTKTFPVAAVHPREGILRVIWKEKSARSYVVAAESVDHPSRPVTPKWVRCYFLACYTIEPLSDGGTTLTYCVTTDVKGSFPYFSTQFVLKRNLLQLREAAQYVEPSADSRDESRDESHDDSSRINPFNTSEEVFDGNFDETNTYERIANQLVPGEKQVLSSFLGIATDSRRAGPKQLDMPAMTEIKISGTEKTGSSIGEAPDARGLQRKNDTDSSLSMTDEVSGRHEDEGMPWVDTNSVERRRSSRRERKARVEMHEFIV